MMRKIYILILLCLLLGYNNMYAQEDVKQDSIINLKDSIFDPKKEREKCNVSNPASFISKQTDIIVGSIFGPSKQLSNADSIINKFDNSPSFGIYKDNYMIVGTNVHQTPTKYNSDAKFQVSIRQRLTNSTLPLKTYLFLTYTQRAFWDIFKESLPFRDLNFNPTLGIGKALVRDNRMLGTIAFQLEHESNGKSGEDSRSWNKISFGSYFTLDDHLVFQTKAWIPIVDGENNPDIIRYMGWGLAALDYRSPKNKYNVGCVIVKRGGLNLNANIILNFSIRLFSDDNQYLFLEYYNGYGESLLEYNQYRQRLRVGIVIKPDLINVY